MHVIHELPRDDRFMSSVAASPVSRQALLGTVVLLTLIVGLFAAASSGMLPPAEGLQLDSALALMAP